MAKVNPMGFRPLFNARSPLCGWAQTGKFLLAKVRVMDLTEWGWFCSYFGLAKEKLPRGFWRGKCLLHGKTGLSVLRIWLSRKFFFSSLLPLLFCSILGEKPVFIFSISFSFEFRHCFFEVFYIGLRGFLSSLFSPRPFYFRFFFCMVVLCFFG